MTVAHKKPALKNAGFFVAVKASRALFLQRRTTVGARLAREAFDVSS
jgi:hypothetical protein